VAKNWYRWGAYLARGSVSTIFPAMAAMLFIQFNVRPAAFLKFCALIVLGPGGEKLVGGVSGEGASVSTIFPAIAAMLFIQFNVRPAAFLKFCALTVPGPGGEKLVSSEGFGFHHFPGHGGHAFYPVLCSSCCFS
jgi:hypothetical protein